jgi:hypothetical protein
MSMSTNSICSKHGVVDPGQATKEEARDAAVLDLQMCHFMSKLSLPDQGMEDKF